MNELGNGVPKEEGTWDYYGACTMRSPNVLSHNTFSVGVFQWESKRNGKGTKRGKVIKRFRGLTSDPGSAYEAALQFIRCQVALEALPVPLSSFE